jgi:uncharacterized coiled-coil protein SlyX
MKTRNGVIRGMSEERMARMEAMIGDLIRIVGNTNSLVEEIKEELDGLKVEVRSLREDVDELKVKVADQGKDIEIIKAAMATKDDIAQLNERFDYLSERLLRQEEDTYRLKRLIGIK